MIDWFLFPIAKHRFVRDARGAMHHFITYGEGKPNIEVTKEDHARGETDAGMIQWAKNLELPVEDSLGRAVLKNVGLIKD